MVNPNGCVIDLHPSAARASVEVHGNNTGHVDAGDAPLRHAAAGVALAAAINEGLFAVDRALVFTFYTYGDSIEELRDYVVENFDTVENLTYTVNGSAPWTLLPGTRFSATLPTSGCTINLQRGNPANPVAFQVYIA